MQAFVRVQHVALSIEVQDPERDGLGDPAQELLAGAHRLVRRHLLGDVESFGDDAPFGLAEQILVGELEPHPGVVGAPIPQPGPTLRTRGGEHVHPALDRTVMVVRVYEVERRAADHLVARRSEHLCRGLVDIDEDRDVVLALHRDTRRDD